MNTSKTGQITQSAAEVYEDFFVPALFQQWTTRVADAAGISSGQIALDVACGTGILTREIARRVGTTGSVVGLDRNQGMLAVAKRQAPKIEWRQGRAEALPFESNSFDAVVCQFGLMFFENRTTALQEMMRVLRPGGHLAVAVWDSLENTPGYAAMAELMKRLFGDRVADAIRFPFILGDIEVLRSYFTDAGIFDFEIEKHEEIARFPSISSWIYAEVKGWTLAETIDESQYNLLLQEAETELQEFMTPKGTISFPLPARILRAIKG